MNKNGPGDYFILAALIPVIVQAAIMIGITFYGFAQALIKLLT